MSETSGACFPAAAHFIGIGGCGMSGLARLLLDRGSRVSGSDAAESERLRALRELGVDARSGHAGLPEALGPGSWCVRSAAIPVTNPEWREARERGLACMRYAEALGRVSRETSCIALAGTHGKTSTSALVVAALRGAGRDPSYVIGGDVPALGGNGHGGEDVSFVVEACEFGRSFHELVPSSAAVLNLEPDHFDCYPDDGALVEAFARFVGGMRDGGTLVLGEALGSESEERLRRAAPRRTRVLRVGLAKGCELRAVELEERRGRYAFTPVLAGERFGRVELEVAGAFQVQNALAALALALAEGAEPAGACRGLSGFPGVRRRFSVLRGQKGGEVVDDYAHLPGEIDAVLDTARRAFPGRRLLVAFQPHQHVRTRALLAEFGNALARADTCLVADIFGAREDPRIEYGVSAQDLATAVSAAGGRARACGGVGERGGRILEALEPGELPIVLGAGELDGVVAEVVRGV